VTGEEHVPAYAVTEDFSVDNFAPVVIVEVADEAGLITADETGLFVASGLNDADTPDPQLSLTARSAAFPGTFVVVISVRNPDGTPGDPIAVDDITFDPSGDLVYTATIEDLTIVENGAYLFQAVALDVDGNREERNASPAIAVEIENFTPPPGFAEEPGINTIIIDDRSVVEVQLAYPGGFPVLNEFVLTFISSDITADNIDIFIDGVSARARGILIVEEIQAEALAAPVATNRQLALQTVLRTFSVSLDTSDPSVVPPGVRNLLGAINKPNGSTTFALPLINVDNIAPLVEIISPTEGQEVSGLPTIHAIFDDGVGGGIDPSNPSTVEVAFTRLPPSGAGPDFRADGTGVQLPQPVSPQVTSQSGDIVYTRSEALPGGAYRATVTLTDSAGNVQAESIEFTVERTLPSVSILSLVAGQVLDKDQQLIINAAFTGAGVQVTAFSINDTAVTPTQESNRLIYTQDAPLLNGESSLLQEGRNTVSIQIADGDGNTAQDTVTFTVTLGDTTPPLIAQVSPQGIIRTATAIVSVVALDDQSGVDSVTLSVDGAEPVNGASLEVTALAPGDHTVVAIATNGAGLPAQFAWSFTVLLDDTPPVISVVAPQGIVKTSTVTASAIVIDEQSNITRVTIALDGEAPPIVVVPSDAGMADDGAAADGAADDGSVAEEAQPFKGGQVSRDFADLTDGTHTVTIVAENAGGSSTHTWTFTVELDTTPPEIVTFAPLGTIRDARPLASVTVSDESGINTDTLRLSIAGVPGNQGTGRRSGSTSRTITFTPTIDVDSGTYTAMATVQDVFGNTTEAEWVFTVELDRVPPQITATAPHGIVRVEKPKISVSASDDLSGVDAIDIMLKSSAGDTVAGLSQTRLDGTSADFTPTNALEAGTYEVDVKVADKGGNVASGKWSFTVEFDTVPPSITVVAPQGDARVTERKPTISATYTDSVSGVDGSSVKLWLDGTPLQIAEDNVSATQVTYTPQVDLEFGRHTVKLEVSDLAPKANTATQEWSFVVESDEIAMVNPRNFPNPFASATTIAFTLAQQAKITIEIYDVTSRLVRPLVQDEQREAGPVAIQWDGKTTEGDDLARGVYFCQITVDSSLEPEAFVLKMALIRDE
jgi:methionine-rich copper-binding protein CopC